MDKSLKGRNLMSVARLKENLAIEKESETLKGYPKPISATKRGWKPATG
jgi:hypothetical protein